MEGVVIALTAPSLSFSKLGAKVRRTLTFLGGTQNEQEEQEESVLFRL